MLSLASAIRHFAFEMPHSAGPRHVLYSSASKANELPFLRGDSIVALFINPCQYPTYVHPPLRKRPSREKAYFQTNLTLGGMGKMGNLPLARPRRAIKRTIAPAKSMGSYLRRSTLLAAKFCGNGHKGQCRSLRPGASQEGWRKTPRVAWANASLPVGTSRTERSRCTSAPMPPQMGCTLCGPRGRTADESARHSAGRVALTTL